LLFDQSKADSNQPERARSAEIDFGNEPLAETSEPARTDIDID
jgi:hypothetical protein